MILEVCTTSIFRAEEQAYSSIWHHSPDGSNLSHCHGNLRAYTIEQCNRIEVSITQVNRWGNFEIAEGQRAEE
jgi:hypothetical protein